MILNAIAPKNEVVAEANEKPAANISSPVEFDTNLLPEYCYPEFQRLSMETYQMCIREGMSYVQVGNVIGNPGTNRGQSGNVEVWNWNENVNGETDGSMSATFVNGELASKAQYGLDSDRGFE